MVLVLIVKNKYQYYLANGACMEYVLSPGCSLVEVIDRLVTQFYSKSYTFAFEEVYVKPEIASALNKEVLGQMSFYVQVLDNPGHGVLKLQTMSGPMTIVARSDLEWPIFIGSEQELKDNSFVQCMEEILCE